MKRWIGLLVLMIMLLSACSTSETTSLSKTELLNASWSQLEKESSNTTVRIFMWGGDDGINRYIDEWVAPRLKKKHSITLERVPMDTNEILQKLLTEQKAKKEVGTIDIVWINGENFKNAKKNGLLFGPMSEKLPNVQKYIDRESLDVQYDFGTAVEGLEAPWGKVQFVFLYDSAKVSEPPTSFEELKNWIEKNPGKFTYPEATDFTGNAFLRHLLYKSVGGPEVLLEKGFDETYANETSEDMWTYLREIQPSLWRNGETYPASLTDLDRLYSQGEVWMTMGYNEGRAESLMKEGVFPKSTKSFVLETGSIGNTHFLAIPFNSPNKAGAMVAINYFLSPEAQLEKYSSTFWGENISLDPTKLSNEDRQKLESMDRGDSVLAPEVLSKHLLPEVDSGYVNWIQENWLNEVVQKK
ncbi:ABC transporter substrate-binding protein [Bacillus timonensis]|nr:ABC transporter substrate-binding protein [Bacillus timonensis]